MTTKTLGIVDYGSGNLQSVRKALAACGARTKLITGPSQLTEIDALVVPGVGSFGNCARNLQAAQLWDPIQEWLHSGKPYLGICLGYHLLFEGSEESPGIAGLGFFPGQVVRFPAGPLKVPHMGWNELTIRKPGILTGLPSPIYTYFVHSYYPVPADDSLIESECEYGVRFASSIASQAIVATQFHPEKSQQTGLRILTHFTAK